MSIEESNLARLLSLRDGIIDLIKQDNAREKPLEFMNNGGAVFSWYEYNASRLKKIEETISACRARSSQVDC